MPDTDPAPMRVRDLIAALSALPQDALVASEVAWAGDVAISDPGDYLLTRVTDAGVVVVRGWMTGCATELEIATS